MKDELIIIDDPVEFKKNKITEKEIMQAFKKMKFRKIEYISFQETIKEEDIIKYLTNFIDGLQQKYLRENWQLPNAILMPRWAFEELKEQTKNQVITSIPNSKLCFMGLEIIPTMEDEFKLITIYKEMK